ncbi:MAG TPA: TonB-dependent receptor [Longimicrobiales bacterium]|nr:TonB-dependent receptor [Longimicrobiales bacterium]
MRVVALSILFLLTSAAAAGAQLRGRVLDIGSGEGVSSASVRLFADGREHEVFTDGSGAYTFRALPPAEYWLIVRHPGYEGVELRVVLGSGSDVVVDVPLEVRPIPVTRVYVPASRARQSADAPGTADSLLTEMEQRHNSALRTAVPAALRDLVQAESREPTSDPGGAPGRSLNVWGSAAERGRVLIDGAAINAPLHLGAILPPIESELLARADLRTAGAPARYDGGTSYIVEYMTRAPAEKLRAWGEIGLLTGRLGVEVPVGSGSVAAAARRVNDEAVSAVTEDPFEYAYSDALVRTAWRTGQGTSFRALAIGTRETVRIPRDLSDDEAAWDNLATAFSWGVDRPGTGPLLSIAYSRGVVELPLLSAPDGQMQATVDRAAFSASNGWRVGSARFSAGIDLERLWLDRRSSASFDPLQPDRPGPAYCTELLPCASADASTAAAFGDVVLQPSRRISLRAGLRATVESKDRPHLLPRFALTWLGNGSTTATLSAGRYSQVGVLESNPGVAATAISELLTPTRLATQYELRLSHRGGAFALEASGFLRRQHMPASVDEGEFVPGVEVSWAVVRDRSSITGGYSMLVRPAVFDSAGETQHLAFLGAGTGRGPLQLDIAGVYGAGVPLTSIVLDRPSLFVGEEPPPETLASIEEGPYMRVDAVLSGDFAFRFNGRSVRITPYAKLINAFARRGALFYYREDPLSELQPLSPLPTMPVVGVRWVF